MTYETALKRTGINVTKVIGIDQYIGRTPQGQHFYLRQTCHNSNNYWVIDIGGNTVGTRCCFRTAVKKIKAN